MLHDSEAASNSVKADTTQACCLLVRHPQQAGRSLLWTQSACRKPCQCCNFRSLVPQLQSMQHLSAKLSGWQTQQCIQRYIASNFESFGIIQYEPNRLTCAGVSSKQCNSCNSTNKLSTQSTLVDLVPQSGVVTAIVMRPFEFPGYAVP